MINRSCKLLNCTHIQWIVDNSLCNLSWTFNNQAICISVQSIVNFRVHSSFNHSEQSTVNILFQWSVNNPLQWTINSQHFANIHHSVTVNNHNQHLISVNIQHSINSQHLPWTIYIRVQSTFIVQFTVTITSIVSQSSIYLLVSQLHSNQ